jgi:NADH dehydrogenase [ubiquinone] 1 alpha subcomplex assembly factor 7
VPRIILRQAQDDIEYNSFCPMKISRFMSEALFNPASGYYRTKNPIGKNSDFITAPEISQTFGELLAAYFLQIAATKKSKIAFVEMGAGKGTLFFDILNSIKKLAVKNIPEALDFLERSTFHIVEIGEVLREAQQKKLAEFSVAWHENFENFLAQNHNQEIFFLSNELFDCFPIDQFVLTEIGWRERIVGGKDFALAPFSKEIHNFVEKEIAALAPIGAVFEFSEAARNFMAQLCEALQKQGGIAINIDYGYIKNEFANTLQALKNHQKCSPLENVGEADLTALVDFAALEKITKNHSLNSSLITQAQFLQGLGIEERRKQLLIKNPEKTAEINSAIDRLIGADQMGDLFKCLIIW